MKNTKRFTALLLSLLLTVAMFTGCSSKFADVSAYLADESVQEELSTEIAAWEGTGITMDIYADGNTLVYACTYDEMLDLSDESVKQSVVDALAAGCADLTDTYTEIVTALREVINGDDIKVRVTYNNADGSEIYSCEFE